MNRGSTLVFGVLFLLIAGCGSGSTGVRTPTAVERCLRADKIGTRMIAVPSGVLPPGFVRHEVVLLVPRDSAGIRIYPAAKDADRGFAAERSTSAVVQQGNVVVVFPVPMPPPNAAHVRQLEACAFGPHARPTVGPLVVALAHPDTGRAVMLRSGCLACHRIGDQGNNGPGANLTGIGTKLSARAIASGLRHPVAPMPSFRNLGRRDFRALVSFLSHLGTS